MQKSIISPLLAGKADVARLTFPLYSSPKMDGVRAIVENGIVYSRTGKPIPSVYVQQLYGQFEGLDGELVCGQPYATDVFRNTQSGVMSKEGTQNVHFYVIDNYKRANLPFRTRYEELSEMEKSNNFPKQATLVKQEIVRSFLEVDAFEAQCLEKGYEGIMLRSINGKYKFGRSTTNEGILLKLKRFCDSEAEVLDVIEQVSIEGIKNNTLGALRVRDIYSNVIFHIGSGFTSSEREDFWDNPEIFKDNYVRYRHFPIGVKDLPRFPVFAGLRSTLDIAKAI